MRRILDVSHDTSVDRPFARREFGDEDKDDTIFELKISGADISYLSISLGDSARPAVNDRTIRGI